MAAAADAVPHCRLMIGPGRARPTAAANPGARGTAAGVFAQQAKNADDGGEHALGGGRPGGDP